MSRKESSSKPTACEVCQGTDLVRRITTYPVYLTGPLEGKQIQVGRVALHECRTCGHLMPTSEDTPRETVMSPWESASFSGSYPELSRPTHACRKLTQAIRWFWICLWLSLYATVFMVYGKVSNFY
jgi:hypothetical protein